MVPTNRDKQMNIESLREHLAIEVMGYHLKKSDPHPTNPYFYYADHRMVCMDCLWKSDENIEQAMGCLDTNPNWTINKSAEVGTYVICVWGEGSRTKYWAGNEKLSLAISLACAKATGWKE